MLRRYLCELRDNYITTGQVLSRLDGPSFFKPLASAALEAGCLSPNRLTAYFSLSSASLICR